jgi:transposase
MKERAERSMNLSPRPSAPVVEPDRLQRPHLRQVPRSHLTPPLDFFTCKALGNRIAAHLGKVKTGRAIRYATSPREALRRFLFDGRVEIDSNIVERAMRPQTIKRKNALFAGSDGGGRTWATVATLLQTAKMNDVDPFAWLTQTLERLANRWPISQIENLMPWN